jgi:hypothetical protein
MIVSEFADASLLVKPLRCSNENATTKDTVPIKRENIVITDKNASSASKSLSKKDDASTGLSNMSSNLKLPMISPTP